MPVTSPRRSSTSGSASFPRPTTPSVGSPTSSYLDHSSSLSKASPSYTSYHSFLKLYSPSSYTPNKSPLRSSYTLPTSNLSGGSSTLGTYRRTPISHLDTSSSSSSSTHDALTSSRYGLDKKPPTGETTLRRGDSYYDTDRLRKKPPSGDNSKRLSASLSSTSLARSATSAADLYEKYSPAYYTPNLELTNSSSRSSLIDISENINSNNNNNYNNNNHANNNNSNNHHDESNITVERPRSRLGRYYTNSESSASSSRLNEDIVDYSGSARARANSINRRIAAAASSSDVPTATFTLRNSRANSKARADDTDESKVLRNGYTSNGLDNKLKNLKLSNSSNNLITNNDENYNDNDGNNNNSNDNREKVNGAFHHDLNSNNNNNNNNKYDNNDVRDVSITATLRLDDYSSGSTNNNKVRSSGTRMSTASPVSSRYYDRSASRNSTYSSGSYNGDADTNSSSTIVENKEGLVGLRNIGNTCFMNSIIQCLSHTTELTKFLRQYEQSSSRTAAKDHLILNEFAKLIKEMWSVHSGSSAPMELKRAFATKHRMYSDFNQQDAQEFLRFFLDSLHCALNSGVKGEPLKIDDNLSDNKKAELTWEWYTRHENSLIRDLFVGQLKSTLRCTVCGNASVTFDPFWDLSVPLPSSSRIKLEHCLDWFIREEILDGDEMPTCSKCKTRRKSTKSFSIQRFPKYLVIHLKRFSETRWSKLSNVVEFPTEERELNMGSYGSNPSSNAYYSLYAISNHMGSTAGGHYVALCKHAQTRRWHEFNDNVVTMADKGQLVSSSAYILFYERS